MPGGNCEHNYSCLFPHLGLIMGGVSQGREEAQWTQPLLSAWAVTNSFGGSVHPWGLGRVVGQFEGEAPSSWENRDPLGSLHPAPTRRHIRVPASQSINGAFNPWLLCSLLVFRNPLYTLSHPAAMRLGVCGHYSPFYR